MTCTRHSVWLVILTSVTAFAVPFAAPAPPGSVKRLPDRIRAEQIKSLRFRMFICWSLSTFSGREWMRGVRDPGFFRATRADTDQWCRVAKAAGMRYILFLTKHHDGFCLWDTDTTDFKVTNSPLGIDVLAKLRRSCDKYGLKLALHFSEGDWSWIKVNCPRMGWCREARAGETRYGRAVTIRK